MLKFVLCDDNDSLRLKLAQILEKIFISHNINANVVLSSNDGKEVISYITQNPVDVLMVDVDLESFVTGLDVSRSFREINKDAYIIFLSGYMDYVFKSLETKIFDYLLKPISYEKLEKCILRLVKDMNRSSKKYLTVGKNKLTLDLENLALIEKNKMKSIFYVTGRKYEEYISLDRLQNSRSDNFVRCHKSYIINKNKITSFDSTTNTITLDNSLTCTVGLKYRNTLREEITNARGSKNHDDTQSTTM